jgi:hypothetical protein
MRNLESSLLFRLTPTPPIDAEVSNQGERENTSPKDAEERADDGQRKDDPAALSSLFGGMDAEAGEPQFTPPLSPIPVAEEDLQGGREEGKCGDTQAVRGNNARSLQLNLRSDVRDAFHRREAAAVSAATAATAAETKGDWILELDGPAGSYACGASADTPCRHTSNPASATVREACCLVRAAPREQKEQLGLPTPYERMHSTGK